MRRAKSMSSGKTLTRLSSLAHRRHPSSKRRRRPRTPPVATDLAQGEFAGPVEVALLDSVGDLCDLLHGHAGYVIAGGAKLREQACLLLDAKRP